METRIAVDMSQPEFESKVGQETSRDIAERDRLITKGRSVLDLCIEQEKVLCIQGFVDSQCERGGVYLEVVREMRDYISAQLSEAQDRGRRKMLRELHTYVDTKLTMVRTARVSLNGNGAPKNGAPKKKAPGGKNGSLSSSQ
jgi:hypothetical protein